jgi:hypothetical protein
LLLIAAFVVEHTKFSPDIHTHTHTLKYRSTLAACFCTNYIFLETLKFSKTPFLKEPIFLWRKWRIFWNIWQYFIFQNRIFKMN